MQTTTKRIIDTVHELASVKPVNGFILDEHGNMNKLENVKEHELLRDQLVREMSTLPTCSAFESSSSTPQTNFGKRPCKL